jgi:flagellar protein FlgJ
VSGVDGVRGAAGAVSGNPRERVRQLAHQMEGVFLNQLFQAMRQAVPQDGVLQAAPGQELFTQLFDERMADEASQRMERGLGEALYRQLARGLPADGTPEAK